MQIASPERRPNPFVAERPSRSVASEGSGSRSLVRTARGPDSTSSRTVDSSGSYVCGRLTDRSPVSSGPRCCGRT